MTAEKKLAHQRLSLIELAEALGSVSEACRRRGVSRQQRVEEAKVSLQDARHAVRSEELRVRADAETVLRNVNAYWRTAQLRGRVREMAFKELRLAQERYRSGLATSGKTTDAQANLSKAERAEIAAIYDCRRSLAALEALVGTTLR